MKRWLILATAFCLIAHRQTFAQLPEGFTQEQLVTGLDPTAMTIAPDGRILIAEKNGKVRIVRDGKLLPDPFLTIQVDNFNERGLGGIALDPDFDRNGYVYIYYTVPGKNLNRVSRVTANGDYAIPGSEVILFDMDPLAGTIHNGGAMLFGTDKKLYISVGDGSDGNTSQRLNSLLGKILRINPDGSIPEDNPFYTQATGKYRAIWARGFRNSYTFAIQPGTGRIFANDVGGENFEEINEIIKGGNYGWNIIEGHCQGQTPPEAYREPVYAYSHAEGCCIIGAAFYNPQVATFPPAYHGKYFFADYCNGWMRVLNPHNGQIESTFITNLDQLVSIVVAPNGDLYYLARAGIGGGSVQDNTSTNNGSLWRVAYTGSGAPFISVQPESVTVPLGEDAHFSVLAQGKAPLSFRWQKNGVEIPNATNPELVYPNVQLSDDGSVFNCLIFNNEGEVSSRSVVLAVTPNTRPVPDFLRPTEGATYAAGDTIFFEGFAKDAEDGILSEEQLTWHIDFHHDEHKHPALDFTTGIASGFFIVPRVGEIDDNVFFRIYLTATDEGGLSRTIQRDVQPRKTPFIVKTEPPGLQMNIDGKTVTTPYTVTSVQGLRRTIAALLTQLLNGQLFSFHSWGNGATGELYTFLAGEQTDIIARYDAIILTIGDGTGLTGNYYHFANGATPESAFEAEPIFKRLDPLINFDWGRESPEPNKVNDELFAVRWTGKVMPKISGKHTFHVFSDDGVRLWVNDQLIIDHWVLQPITESSGSIDLEAGRKYDVKLEYFDNLYDAACQLHWSTDRLPMEVVPTSQLFPGREVKIPAGEDYAIRVSPNPANNVLNLEIDSKILDRITWRIYDAQGREVTRGAGDIFKSTNLFEIDISKLASGAYFVTITGRSRINGHEQFVKH